MLKLALKNLTRRKTRTVLTVLGITIAISFTVGLLSISEGFIESFNQSLEGRGEDIFVLPEEVAGHPMPMLESYGARFLEEDIEKIQAVDNVKAVYPIYTQTFYFADTKGSIMEGFAGLNGIIPAFLTDLRPFMKIEEGRFLEKDDEYKIVIGSKIAKTRNLSAGDIFEIREENFEIAGVLEESGDLNDMIVYVPIQTLQKTYDEEGKLTMAAVTVKDIDETKETAQTITDVVPGIVAKSVEEFADMMADLLSMARAMHLSIASIALLIGVLFILSTMTMAVNERKKEIGTMRAIGAHRSQIFKLILAESLIMSIVAGILGCVGGYVLSEVMTYVLSEIADLSFFAPLVTLRILALGMIVSVFIGGVAGLIPALNISKTNIVDVLRHE